MLIPSLTTVYQDQYCLFWLALVLQGLIQNNSSWVTRYNSILNRYSFLVDSQVVPTVNSKLYIFGAMMDRHAIIDSTISPLYKWLKADHNSAHYLSNITFCNLRSAILLSYHAIWHVSWPLLIQTDSSAYLCQWYGRGWGSSPHYKLVLFSILGTQIYISGSHLSQSHCMHNWGENIIPSCECWAICYIHGSPIPSVCQENTCKSSVWNLRSIVL